MSSSDGIRDPKRIEAESFAIIDREVGGHGFDSLQWPVVRRVIHTTADFDFARITRFSPGAVGAGIEALRRGLKVFCDTTMVQAGVNKPRLAAFGSEIQCHIADEDVARQARQKGITRSAVAVGKGVADGCGIYLIGNAPTALFRLLHLADQGLANPSLVVGVPVGFVGAEESKEALLASKFPFITCRGRKGGSAIAAAVLNSLMILAEET
jgi:precorrin-8X/cobalt-precorrin-8 methylmutase